MPDDAVLLRRYANGNANDAFAEIVRRHLGLVYAAALRQLGGVTHRAEEVTQAVFIDLARKAATLSRHGDLSAWLYTSTHYAAAKLKRTEQRRQAREQEAHLMTHLMADDPAADWERLRPVLDEALHELGEADREAVVLRYFQDRRFAEMGRQLGLTEDAARMRVERALDRLRVLLAKRSITSSSAALALVLANAPAAAIPAGLASAVTSVAVGGAAVGSGALAVAWLTNAKTAIAAIVAMVAGGFAIYEAGQARQTRSEMAALAQEHAALQAKMRVLQTWFEAPGQPSTDTVAAAGPGGSEGAQRGPTTMRSEVSIYTSTSGVGTIEEQLPDLMREEWDATYGGLYRQLQWTSAQQDQFRAVLAAAMELRDNSAMTQAAKELELPGNGQEVTAEKMKAFEAMAENFRAALQATQIAAVREAMGDDVGLAMERYVEMLPVRAIAMDVAKALFESATPLAASDADRLARLLAQYARDSEGKLDLRFLAVEAASAAAQAEGLLTSEQAGALQRASRRHQTALEPIR